MFTNLKLQFFLIIFAYIIKIFLSWKAKQLSWLKLGEKKTLKWKKKANLFLKLNKFCGIRFAEILVTLNEIMSKVVNYICYFRILYIN